MKNTIEGTLKSVAYTGPEVMYLVGLKNDTDFRVIRSGVQARARAEEHKIGEDVLLGWDAKNGVFLERVSMVEGLDIEKIIYGR
jgi:hypothetical protein